MERNENTLRDFNEFFDLDKMQSLQNAVAKNQNIASLILDTNGNNITKPSSFSVGLISLVKKYPGIGEYFEQGLSKIIRDNDLTAKVVRNKAGEIMAGCAPIVVNDKKVATWIIGGVIDKNAMKKLEVYKSMAYAQGVSEKEFNEAKDGIHLMTADEFLEIFEVVKLFAEQLSDNYTINFAQKNELIKRKELLKELKETNVALEIQAERYRLISECSDEIIFDYNVDTDTVIIPGGTGDKATTEQVLSDFSKGDKYKTFIHPDDYAVYESMLAIDHKKETDIQFEARMNLFTGGEYIWYRINLVFFTNEDNHTFRVIGRIHDIDKEKEELMLLEAQIKKDPMTGLLNKNATKISIEKFFKECDPDSTHALMIIDIDDFKNVNDTFGHLFGDMVIENVAAAISTTFRKFDIVGRIGGDEFLVLMKNTGKRIAEIKARDLCKTVKRTYTNEKKSIEISCSIGLAFFADDDANYEDLFGKADIAMYNAKLEGKNSVAVYDANKEQKFAEITKEDTISHRYGEEHAQNFLHLACGLLLESKDIDTSVQILTERIAEKYSIQKVVFTITGKQRENMIYSWDSHIREYQKRGLEEFPGHDAVADRIKELDFVVINDTAKEQEEVMLAEYFAQFGITALIGCNIIIEEGIEEIIVYANTDAPRCWTDYEKTLFRQISDVLALCGKIKLEKTRNERTVTTIASSDAVTGLYNVTAFEDEVVKILKQYGDSKHYIMAYLDINNFSYINEKYGVAAGNVTLCNVADMLKEMENTIVCRIFADHFVLFHYSDEEFDMDKTVFMHEELYSNQQKVLFNSGMIKLTTGIYYVDYKQRNIALAIENANFARKKAKAEAGLMYVIFDKDMERQRDDEQLIASSFERALDNGAFELFMQPNVSLITDTVVGAEALVRWRMPDGTYRLPKDFIKSLEKHNYMQRLDFYIFEKVLQTMEEWIEDGNELIPVSVNFSKVSTNSPYFVDNVMNMFNKYKVPRRYIEIEIKEDAFYDDSEYLNNNLFSLKNKGMTIILDDFGRGSSSLGSLLTSAVDIVKIDKMYLDGLDDSIIKQDCVSNIVTLISSMKKQVIIEGVENREQADFLHSCGVSIAQGYLFGEPIKAEDFAEEYFEW